MKPSLEQFYRENIGRAVARVDRAIRNNADAQDIAHNVMEGIIGRYDEIESPVHYLNASLTNAIFKYRKENKDNPGIPFDFLDPESVEIVFHDLIEDNLEQVDKEQAKIILSNILTKADELTQLVFEDKFFLNLTQKEIMEKHQLSYVGYRNIIDTVKEQCKAILNHGR